MEEWQFHKTRSGTPQGGIVSPILAHIYLDQLDKLVERTLIPDYSRGLQRARNKAYNRITAKVSRLRKAGKREEAKALTKIAKATPPAAPMTQHSEGSESHGMRMTVRHERMRGGAIMSA